MSCFGIWRARSTVNGNEFHDNYNKRDCYILTERTNLMQGY